MATLQQMSDSDAFCFIAMLPFWILHLKVIAIQRSRDSKPRGFCFSDCNAFCNLESALNTVLKNSGVAFYSLKCRLIGYRNQFRVKRMIDLLFLLI